MFILVIAVLISGNALAQDQVKSSIIVENDRFETIDMRVTYKFRDHGWTLIEHAIEPGGGITYKYPSGLPGCDLLNSWGLDTAQATFSTGSQQICLLDFNMCEARVYRVAITRMGCGTQSNTQPAGG